MGILRPSAQSFRDSVSRKGRGWPKATEADGENGGLGHGGQNLTGNCPLSPGGLWTAAPKGRGPVGVVRNETEWGVA